MSTYYTLYIFLETSFGVQILVLTCNCESDCFCGPFVFWLLSYKSEFVVPAVRFLQITDQNAAPVYWVVTSVPAWGFRPNIGHSSFNVLTYRTVRIRTVKVSDIDKFSFCSTPDCILHPKPFCTNATESTQDPYSAFNCDAGALFSCEDIAHDFEMYRLVMMRICVDKKKKKNHSRKGLKHKGAIFSVNQTLLQEWKYKFLLLIRAKKRSHLMAWAFIFSQRWGAKERFALLQMK